MSSSVKYIFVTGGVSSSLGKGILAASLAKLLQARGHTVTIQKLDPYINIDPGTLNPYEHGECFVTNDGAETDLDLGHYERFLNSPTSQANNVTTGRIYQSVIEKERKGEFLGKTVQVVPHITDEIKNRIQLLGETGDYEFIITEIGGTVGDIESLPYIEAVRQLKWDLGKDALVIHLTLIPFLAATGELKTKPTQHSVKLLLEYGIQPNVLVCRTEHTLNDEIKNKIARFCNVGQDAVIEAKDASTIYEVPLLMEAEKLDEVVLKQLEVSTETPVDLTNWKKFLTRLKNPTNEITLALVGKYVELKDSYKSITESLIHAGALNDCKVNVRWIHAEKVTPSTTKELFEGINGILVAPGFGKRGVEGKISAVQFARENNVPFLGICLGMQCAVVEFARNVLGLSDANSSEMNSETANPVIALMKSQEDITDLGGTMRLGSYPCTINEGTKAWEVYKNENINERHRHRYEFNDKYIEAYNKAGMIASGKHPETKLIDVVEIPNHPWFVGVQFHPEYKSSVANPHPLFVSFVKAMLEK